MRRLIPPKTRQRLNIIGKFDWLDILFLFLSFLISCLILSMNGNFILKLCFALGIFVISLSLSFKSDGVSGYELMFDWFKFLFRKKHILPMDFYLSTQSGMNDNILEVTNGKKSLAISIGGIDFGILPESIQDNIIESISNCYKNITDAKIVKLDRPIDFEEYIKICERKIKYWQNILDEDNDNIGASSRIKSLEKELNALRFEQDTKSCTCSEFYLILFDEDEQNLFELARDIIDTFNEQGVGAKICDSDEFKELYRLYYNCPVELTNEQGNFYTPDIVEKINKIIIDGETYKIATIKNLPFWSGNAWLWRIFSIPDTKVVMNFRKSKEINKQIKDIDRSLPNLKANLEGKNNKESDDMDIIDKIQGLTTLLMMLKGSEVLFDTNVFILYPEYASKEVELAFTKSNIEIDRLGSRQIYAYLQMGLYYNAEKDLTRSVRPLQSSCLASTFPFVTKKFLDTNGFYIGDSYSPVFLDLLVGCPKPFERRTNGNMAIFGKTGSGKSFFEKTCLLNLACEDEEYGSVKIFILDPDNEYDYMGKNLGGNYIDVGGLSGGKINPLQVLPTLSEKEDGVYNEVSNHRAFLQQFFRVTTNIDKETEHYLNQALASLYDSFGINDETDLNALSGDKFPIMDDLYNVVAEQLDTALNNNGNSYDINQLKKLKNILSNFKSGGVYASLWNGFTTFDVSSSMFNVLNFQSLFSSSNENVNDGQVLLILRLLNQEMVKNRNINERENKHNKIVIAVDECHKFTHSKECLTFLSSLAKVCRKFSGSLIIATQNLKDFYSGDETTKRLASTVVNNCQYTAFFGLNPDDVNSVKELYSNTNNGLNEEELNNIASFKKGQALMIVDSKTRFSLGVHMFDGQQEIIETR